MRRRTFVAALGAAGATATAGCSALRSSETLSDPTVGGEGPRRYLQFTEGGSEVASFGFDADVTDGRIHIGSELSHSDATNVKSIELRVWLPTNESDTPAEVAVVSPVEGDSSPPPELHLHTPERARGTLITVEDLDDLKDETISTLELLVVPPATGPSMGVPPVAIDAEIELGKGGMLGKDYTLDGQLELTFPNY